MFSKHMHMIFQKTVCLHNLTDFKICRYLPEQVLLSLLRRKCVGQAQWWVVPDE